MKAKLSYLVLVGVMSFLLAMPLPALACGSGGGSGGSGGGGGGGAGGGGEGVASLGPDWASPSAGGFGTAGGTVDLNNLPDRQPMTPQDRLDYEMRIAHTRSSLFDIASGIGQVAQISVAFTPLGLKHKMAIAIGSAAGQAGTRTSAVGSGALAGTLEAATSGMNPLGGLLVSEGVTRLADHAVNNGAQAPSQNIGTAAQEASRVDTGRMGMPSSGHDVFR